MPPRRFFSVKASQQKLIRAYLICSAFILLTIGKIDRKFARILKNLKDNREDGDYEVFTIIDRDIAENAIKEAEEFLKEAKRYLAKYLKK